MKKKLLFVIPSLEAGGGEKSLVNLLNTLDFNKFQVDLVLLKKSGIFLKLVPSQVVFIELGDDYTTFTQSISTSVIRFLKQGKIKLIWARICYSYSHFIRKNKGKSEQIGWKFLKKSIPILPKHYDAAIGFLEKTAVYFVVDSVVATKKIGFIHNDYNKLDLDKNFDLPFFKQLNTIATVSEACAEVLKENFPSEQHKVKVILNIVSESLIEKLALATLELQPKHSMVLSIGRLHPQKGFDLALQAAVILKNQNVLFQWFVIGEGAERAFLENQIKENELQDHFILLGLKENPYPYLKRAAVCVQTSRYEGKSIAIDEAKILKKPIVVTNFTTAKDQIQDHETGLIVAMDPESIAQGIRKFLTDTEFKNRIITNLQSEHFGTESEIEKINQLF